MNPQSHLEHAIAAAVGEMLDDDAEPFVLGNYVAVAETVAESGPGLVVLAPAMTPDRLSLLVKAIDHIIERFLIGNQADTGIDSDAG